MVTQSLDDQALDYLRGASLYGSLPLATRVALESEGYRGEGLTQEFEPVDQEHTEFLEDIASDDAYLAKPDKKKSRRLLGWGAIGVAVAFLVNAFGGGGSDESKPTLGKPVIFHGSTSSDVMDLVDGLPSVFTSADIYDGNVVYDNTGKTYLYNGTENELGWGISPQIDELNVTSYTITEGIKHQNLETGLEQTIPIHPAYKDGSLAYEFEGHRLAAAVDNETQQELVLHEILQNVTKTLASVQTENVSGASPVINTERQEVAWVNPDNWTYEVYNFAGEKVFERNVSEYAKNSTIFPQFDFLEPSYGLFLLGAEENGIMKMSKSVSLFKNTGRPVSHLRANYGWNVGIDEIIFFSPTGSIEDSGMYSYHYDGSSNGEKVHKLQDTFFANPIRANGDQFVWSAQNGTSMGIHAIDPTGQVEPPLILYPVQFTIQELSELQYSSLPQFLNDGIWGTDRDLRFDYIDSKIQVTLTTNRPVDSLELVLEMETGVRNTYEMDLIETSEWYGHQIFELDLEVAVPSTAGEIAASFAEALLSGTEPVAAAGEAIFLGTAKSIAHQFHSAKIVGFNYGDNRFADTIDHPVTDIYSSIAWENIEIASFIKRSDSEFTKLTDSEGNYVSFNAPNVLHLGPAQDFEPEFIAVIDDPGTLATDYNAEITGLVDGGLYDLIKQRTIGEDVISEQILRDISINASEVHINGVPINTNIDSNPWTNETGNNGTNTSGTNDTTDDILGNNSDISAADPRKTEISWQYLASSLMVLAAGVGSGFAVGRRSRMLTAQDESLFGTVYREESTAKIKAGD